MAYCTVVEFEWGEGFDVEGFGETMASLDTTRPAGRVSKIVGIDEKGARVIEVWESGDAARRFAEESAPRMAGVTMPPPSRVYGFAVTSYDHGHD
ncbi:MAG TPA: hypothetical protein VGS21_03560 [Acidimicrobiales bacterium]|nr:hypothetical protein [Acidimicrobiales bacterium]